MRRCPLFYGVSQTGSKLALPRRLVSRSRADALITDPAEAGRRAVQMATEGTVASVEGSTVRVNPDTLSLHSDTPNAAAMLAAVRRALGEAGVAVRNLG